jgi:hypothetical protein
MSASNRLQNFFATAANACFPPNNTKTTGQLALAGAPNSQQ